MADRRIAFEERIWLEYADRPRRQLAAAVTIAVTVKTEQTKLRIRQALLASGLGQRVGNIVGSKVYPGGGKVSLRTAGLIHPRGEVARDILEAFDLGVTIRSQDGFYLSVPAPGYAAFVRNKPRLTPGEFERLVGVRLRFVYRRTGPSMLVVDQARATPSGGFRLATKRQRVLWNTRQRGNMATVPVFWLVPQVTLRKRVDVVSELRRGIAETPDQVAREMVRLGGGHG